MADSLAPLAIMGGAFDPVHFGHLRTAAELMEACGLGEIKLVPSARPPHRSAHIASPELRVQMLTAAVAGVAGFSIDQRELERDGPSYSVTTLEELRGEIGARSLCMILGMDAFLGLPGWHRWEELSALAHLIVAHRPGWQPPQVGELGDFTRTRRCDDPLVLQAEPAGKLFIHEVTQLEISSSDIRRQMAQGGNPRFLMPEPALQIARASGCYSKPADRTRQEKSAHA